MTPRAQLYAVVLACMLALVAALSGIYLWAAQDLRQELAQQRNHFLLNSLRSTTENYLAIGLDLDQMQALQSLIDRERTSFPQVLAIDVFSAKGQVFYSTDAGSRGLKVPEDWVQKLAENGAWETQDPTQDQMGMRFENDLGRAAGGIVLTLVPADSPLTLSQWRSRGVQGLELLGLTLLGCAMALLLAALVLKRIFQPYRQVAEILKGQPPPSNSGDAASTELKAMALTAQGALNAKMAQTSADWHKLEEIDHAD